MLRFAARYGPVSRFSNPVALGGAAGWVMVTDPDDIQHVCGAASRNYQERFLPDVYTYVTHGRGILGSSGAYNKRHRRLCGPPFRSPALLRRFGDVVVERAGRVADVFASQPAPVATNVAVQVQRLALDVVGLTAFSHDFGQADAIARDMAGAATPSASAQDRLLWAVNAFGQVLAKVFIAPLWLLRALDALGFRCLRTLREALAVMRGTMLGVIAQRRQALAAAAGAADPAAAAAPAAIATGGSGSIDSATAADGTAAAQAAAQAAPEPQDLLDVLLLAVDDEGRPMTDEELWEDVHDVMGAGHETTASTTAAALHAVGAHPEVEARLLAELREVLGERAPSYDDLPRLPYLAAVVKEVLRLYPAIPLFPRCAAAADVLPSGHAIRAGDVVFMSPYALHRSPAVWADPLRFDPERFLGQREAELHRYAWLPFGAGPRMCLGAAFAQMTVALALATLLQRCTFRPLHPAARLIPASYDITLTFDRTGGLLMEAAPRGG